MHSEVLRPCLSGAARSLMNLRP